jgi:hypothetical protein
MTEIKYALSVFEQFKIKLYSYYTYPGLSLHRMISGPIIILLGFFLYTNYEKAVFYRYGGMAFIFFGIYFCLRPFLLLGYHSFKSSFASESATLDTESGKITICGSEVSSTINLASIEKITALKWGYRLQIAIEKRKVFLFFPYRNVTSGDLDAFIQEIRNHKL